MSIEDKQVYACCRAVVRFVAERGLSEGDRLPSQEEIRSLLGFSHNTISPAMALLVESGMLSRQRKSGTVVVDPLAWPEGLWRVALVFGPRDRHPENLYFSLLHRVVHEQLLARGCALRHYTRGLTEADQVTPHSLSHFGNLEQDVRAGLVDGILTPAFFSSSAADEARQHQVCMCQLGGASDVPLRVELDSPAAVELAVSDLAAQGCQTVTLAIDEAYLASVPAIGKKLSSSCRKAGIQGMIQTYIRHDLLQVGDELMQVLFATPARAAPDGVIVLNDMLGLRLSALFARNKVTVLMAVGCNLQIPLFYATPVMLYAFDVDELAQKAVDALLQRMTCPGLPDKIESIRPIRL